MSYLTDTDDHDEQEQIRRLESLLRDETEQRLELRRRLATVRELILLVCESDDVLPAADTRLKLVADFAYQPTDVDDIPF